MSGGVAATTARHLHAELARTQVAGRLPSVTAGVVRHGALVWSGGHGLHVDAGGSAAAGPDTQYRIGSITKTLTAVLVLRLREDGLVDLSDPVGRHVRESAFADVTLREVLSHSGGLPAEPAGDWWERSDGAGWGELVDAHREAAPALPRGSAHHYSNLGYALLGEVVARLRDRPWWDCVRAELLDPLDMARTTYAAQPPCADGWSLHPWLGTLVPEPATDTGALAPAGQVWSTVTDLGRWASFLATGRDDVLPSSALDEATRPHVGAAGAGAGAGSYGLGLRLLDHEGRRLVGHTGSMPGFLASLFVDRERCTGAVALANATIGLPTEEVAPRLLATLERHEPWVPPPWRPPAGPPAWLADALGVWHWGNSPFTLRLEGEDVVMHRLEAPAAFAAYRPTGTDRLRGTRGYHHGEELHVHRNDDGSVSHLTGATFVWTRTPYDPAVEVPGGHPLSRPATPEDTP